MLRRVVLRILFLLQMHRWMRWFHRDRVIVLMYHGFTAAPEGRGIANLEGNHVHVDRFRRQIAYLARWHHVLRLEDFLAAVAGRKPLPPYPVIVTMDDGYKSVFEIAFPILAQHGVPASVFLTTAFVENAEPLWPDRIEFALDRTTQAQARIPAAGRTLALVLDSDESRVDSARRLLRELKQLPHADRRNVVQAIETELGCSLLREDVLPPLYRPLDWDDIRRMIGSDLISIGNHTHTHPILSRCEVVEQESEIGTAHRVIHAATGVRCRSFCYPNGQPGDFDETTKQHLRALGYACGLTTVPGWNDLASDPFELRRVAINDRATLDDFKMILYGGLRQLARDVMHRRNGRP